MFSFYSYFWNNNVYINGKYKYVANEILTAYLNTNYLSLAEEFLHDLKKLKNKLLLIDDMEYDALTNYNSNVYSAMNIFSKINDWLAELPPYNQIIKTPIMTFDELLNYHSFFFDDGMDNRDESITWDTVTEFGCGEQNEYGNWKIRIHKFSPIGYEEENLCGEDMRESLRETNQSISLFFDKYIEFINSYIEIQNMFKPFIENYLHRKGTFLNENEVAQCFTDFNKSNGNAFSKIKCKMNSFGYKVLNTENNQALLCEEIMFPDLQSFVYYDFFNGIKKRYIPNKCKHCGKFFLIRSGKYFCYCDNPLKDEPNKTCRDVGSKRSYDDKCKNDPIWQTYNRAYKTHYARYMKKKMTTAEFEQWSRFASEFRDKAIAGEVNFEQYYADIRK